MNNKLFFSLALLFNVSMLNAMQKGGNTPATIPRLHAHSNLMDELEKNNDKEIAKITHRAEMVKLFGEIESLARNGKQYYANEIEPAVAHDFTALTLKHLAVLIQKIKTANE